MIENELIERTPSIYFRFDDESQRQNSKSTLALDYSISNQKYVMSNRLAFRNSGNKLKERQELSPFCDMKKHSRRGSVSSTNELDQSLFEPQRFKRIFSSNTKNQGRLQTEQFFQQFETKYDITFEHKENDIFVNEWIPEAENEEGSKISRGNLFEELESTLKNVKIKSKKDQIESLRSSSLHDEMASEKFESSQNGTVTLSQVTIKNQDKTARQLLSQEFVSNQNSLENFSLHQLNNHVSNEEFEEVISFGNNQTRMRRYKHGLNSRHFVTRDFQNNSSLLDKGKPAIELKRRQPLKSIQNIIQKNCSKDKQTNNQTRKKPIINADLFISTINKNSKIQTKQTTKAVWSNPINTRKSPSLESTFSYDNMFKTNAFRETLKSTTLENWKKKYHQKIEHLGEKRTVSKKRRDGNIFDNLFIRA